MELYRIKPHILQKGGRRRHHKRDHLRKAKHKVNKPINAILILHPAHNLARTVMRYIFHIRSQAQNLVFTEIGPIMTDETSIKDKQRGGILLFQKGSRNCV